MLITLKFISNPDFFQLQTTTTKLITGTTTLGTFLFCPTLNVAHHRNCYLHALVVEKKTKSNSLLDIFLSLHICNPLTINSIFKTYPNSLISLQTPTQTKLLPLPLPQVTVSLLTSLSASILAFLQSISHIQHQSGLVIPLLKFPTTPTICPVANLEASKPP